VSAVVGDDAAWDAVERADFGAWTGLPSPAPYAGFERRFPRLVDGEARVLLGSEAVEARYRIHVGDAYPQHLRVSYAGDEIVLVEADLPRLAQPVPELLAALGEPAERLDDVWGVLRLPGGLHVHPERGIAVGVGPEGQVLHVELFAAGDLDTYLRTRRHGPAPLTERP
jgi:hypothetical protein